MKKVIIKAGTTLRKGTPNGGISFLEYTTVLLEPDYAMAVVAQGYGEWADVLEKIEVLRLKAVALREQAANLDLEASALEATNVRS